MLEEARQVLGKGKDAFQGHVQEFVDGAQVKGKRMVDEARKQSVGILALATRHGLNLLEDWADLASKNIPKRRRSSGNAAKFLVGLAAVAAVGYFLVAANKAAAPTEAPV
jgi:hypothetical protein